MGFREPKYAGHCIIRGLGIYPEGQPFEQVINYMYGRGLRAGFVPISATKIFWFICSNSSSPGPRTSSPSVLREKAAELLKTFPSDFQTVVDRAPDDCIVKSPLVDRWLWPGITPPPSKGNIVLIGDAWHPMTPNLGQGACCALEDSVVLAKKLGEALNGNSSVEDAFKSYAKERWSHVFPITVSANLVGKFFQSESQILCSLRNNIVIPKLFSLKQLSQKLEFEHKHLK
ncbi:hypothetical protein Leryth_027382 [Lithospermum erythrorhizon]|nr:hypothetical protein Leryth_027382 [Lithospermum erythrorhizon]